LSVAPDAVGKESQAYLPDFCAPRTIFVVIMFAELVAIAIALAAEGSSGNFLGELSKTSLFNVWFVLLASGMFCQLRNWLESLGKTQAFVVGFILLQTLALLLAEAAYLLTVKFGQSLVVADSHFHFLLRTFAISLIINALAMRYLYVSSEWRRSILLEARAKISALQALIRPHFLFNSMNTIASLTRTDPKQAEEAVEDLADLLRANWKSSDNHPTIKEELEVAAMYQRIEKLRLGDRLRVKWDIAGLPLRARIPSLTIQPLLENAIYHGIEGLAEGGLVTVSGKLDGDLIELRFTNPVAPNQNQNKHGNQMAFANIQQRLEIAYGSRVSVKVTSTDDSYSVCIRYPHEELRT
jgi:two-component system sensor histidine kinase AlgZ